MHRTLIPLLPSERTRCASHLIHGILLSLISLSASASDETASAPAPETSEPSWTAVEGVDEVQNIFPSSLEPTVVYVADAQHLWLSRDAGAHFAMCATAPELPGPVTALLLDPLRPGRMYAGTQGHGVLASDDAGLHWHASAGEIATTSIDTLVFSPGDRTCATIYATHGLEHPGISESVDAGATWHSFAEDYAVAGLVVLDDDFFCAAANPAQGAGFFRHDASKGWYCVLPEPPRTVLASPADGHRLWFSSRDTGISRSDNAGISTARVGPPDIDVESMAIDLTATGQETVFAFAPQSQGVIASSDGFVTWTPQTRGLEPSQWIQEGARMAIACDGSVLYACANGHLLRCVRQSQPSLGVHAIPAVAVSGSGPLMIQAICPGAGSVVADLSALGADAAMAMHDDGTDGDEHAGDGVFSVRLDIIPEQVTPGMKVVPVRATNADGTIRSGRVTLRVMPPASDVVMWQPGQSGLTAARVTGAWVGLTTFDQTTGEAYLRLRCDGAGQLIMPLIAPHRDSIAAKDHAVICFGIRCDQPGPVDLHCTVHDNGQGSGSENAQPSHTVSITTYLPSVDDRIRIVSIPLGDLLEGSTCSPNLIDVTMSSTAAIKGSIGLYRLQLLAQPGPIITDAAIMPLPDGRMSVFCTACGRDVRPLAATVRLGARALPLPMIGPGTVPSLAGVAAYRAALDGDLREETTASFSTQIAVQNLSPGQHHLELQVSDAHGITLKTVAFDMPSERPMVIAGANASAPHAVPDQASDFAVGSGVRALHARLAWEPDGLDLAVAVSDDRPDAYTLPATVYAAVVKRCPHAELLIQAEDPAALRHKLDIAWTVSGPHAWCDGVTIPCSGVRTPGGYEVTLKAPILLREHGLVGPGAAGRVVQVEWTLTTGDRHLLSWKPHPGDHPEHAGAAILTDPIGPVRLSLEPSPLQVVCLSADRSLADDALLTGSWLIAGEQPLAVQLSSDHRRVWLIPRAWPVPPGTITGPGVHGRDGAAVGDALTWPGPSAPTANH